jgi:ATP-dependent DNA helicase RecG
MNSSRLNVINFTSQISSLVNEKFMNVLSFCDKPKSRREILEHIGLKYHTDNYNRYIKPLIVSLYLQPTDEASTNSPQQRYIITDKGRGKL